MTKSRPIGRIALYVGLILVCLLFTLPMWWTLVTSLKPPESMFRYVYPFSLLAFVPTEVGLGGYVELFATQQFAQALLNSSIVAAGTVVLGVIVNGLAGFVFATLKFPGRRVLFVVVVFSFLIPTEAVLIPLYQLVDRLGWINSYAALIIPIVPSGLIIFMFRQFFLGIPRELYETSVIDGAGPLRIFWSIYLPLTRPAVITASLLIFLIQWQSYLWPLVTVRTRELWTAQLTISNYVLGFRGLVDWEHLLPGIVVTALIPILILMPLQRFIQLSFVQGGVKG